MILADLIDLIVREAPKVLGVTLLLVFGVLWLLLGSLGMALLCVLPAAATLGLSLALMPLVGLKLNFLNVVMLPVLFGIAVDGGVHLVTRLRHAEDFVGPFEETARGITGAVLTTALGFGALTLADHPGLRSLGALAVLGLGVNLLVCLVGMGGLLALRRRRRASLSEHISTVGFAGYSPLGPGTVGAMSAFPIAWALQDLSAGLRWGVVALLTVLATLAVVRFIRGRGDHDPSEVVIDEMIGCLIALCLVPWTIGWAAAAFVMFRLFDIVKPWPVSVVDRRTTGALGVLGDDVLAGLMAGTVLVGVRALFL